MDVQAESIAGLSGLFQGDPGPEEALRLLAEPGEAGLPESLGMFAALYGYEVPELSPSLSGP